jgi:hypothetical protein
VKFYPYGFSSADFSITVWTGNTPNLELTQSIALPIFEQYNTVDLDENIYVDASKDLWIGIWVQNQPVGEYPGGVDAGPAVVGLGDLISFDDGDTWESLYDLNNDLNFNWNLQVYVQTGKDKSVEIQRSTTQAPKQRPGTKEKRDMTSNNLPVASSLTEENKKGGIK